MANAGFSDKQIRILDIATIVVVMFMIVFGLILQFKNWNLPGGSLVLVGIGIVNLMNLLRARLSVLSARLDELERRVAVGRG